MNIKKKTLDYCFNLLLWKVLAQTFLLVTTNSDQIRMVHSHVVASALSAAENLSTSTPITTTKAEFKSTPITQRAHKTSSSSLLRTSADTFMDRNINNRQSESISTRFTNLEKEVVEALIKRWAPLVWLAPEEKFMPLGVDEFLQHVHPEDKRKTMMNNIPVGDNSVKAYLVTNTNIDELLENNTSFLYGQDPNDKPVPIYAITSICSASRKNLNNFEIKNTYNESPKSSIKGDHQQQQQQPIHSPEYSLLQITRDPYIPIPLKPYDESNNTTILRSSRLYPYFKKIVKRQIPMHQLLTTTESLTFDSYGYHFVRLGKSSIRNGKFVTEATEADTLPQLPDTSKSPINQFIANLADNVKFAEIQDDSDNIINTENIPEYRQQFEFKKEVPSFHVTYWMFYPYSQGKTMCTLNLGPLGHIPFPTVYGFCLGTTKDIGSHIGDWEHMSLYFNGVAEPESMYVSAHDAGAYYSYNRLTGSFEFKKQETRKGLLQRPNFPKTVTTFNNHPVLFAAKGSHGLWTAPGKHRFVKVARLYDINGFGTAWKTWKEVHIAYNDLETYSSSLLPNWLSFKGKWGNPKSKCHPFQGIGLNFCEYTDGPTGIPLKQSHFQCDGADTLI